MLSFLHHRPQPMTSHIALISSILFLGIFTGRNGCVSLEITTVSSDLIQFEGSNVTLGCTVGGRGFDYFFNQIIWYKVLIDNSKDEESEVQINTGAIINEPFYSTRRYQIEPVMTEYSAEISLLLTITGIQREDNGTYRCVLFNKQQRISIVRHTLYVPAPVDSLDLSLYNLNEDMDNSSSEDDSIHVSTVATDNGSHGDRHELEENKSVRVICVARGAGRIPDILVTFGQRTDITSQFNRVQSERKVGHRGLDIVYYEVRLVRDWFRLTADDDGKHIKCTARVHDIPEMTRRVSKSLEVRYAPKFICGKERMVSVKERSYRLECAIRANPIVNVSDITWQIGDVNVTNMTVAEVYDVFSSTAQIDAERRNQLNVALTISEMSLAKYNIYRLLASNSVGRRHFHIALRQSNARPSTSVNIADSQTYDVIYSTNKAHGIRHTIVMSSFVTCILRSFFYTTLNV